MPDRKIWGSAALALIGSGAIALMLRHIGLGPIVAAFREVGPALWALVALELAVLGAEATASGVVLGVAPSRALWRGAIAAYVAALVLPAGRMAGELFRVAHLDVPRGRAAMGILGIHGAHVTVGALCALILGVVLSPAHPLLGGTVIACGAWTALIAVGLLAASRSLPVAQWLCRRMGLTFDVESARIDGRTLLRAGGWAAMARALHLAQAVVLARAMFEPADALAVGAVIEALQHVAGSVGDAVPGQAGVLEGTFGAFRAALGPHTDLGTALAAALVLRSARLGLGAALGVAHVALGPSASPRLRPS